MTSPDGGLWDWALRVYAAPGVAAACLELQDRWGADVDLLLYLAWRGADGRELDAEAQAQARAAVQRWRDEVVAPLRVLRRALKSPPEGIDADRARALRERVAALEIDAERAEIECLGALPAPPAGCAPAAAVAVNLQRYAGWLATGRADAPESDTLPLAAPMAVLAQAAAAVAAAR